MCLSVRQYQIIYFVIVRLDDIQDVVCNRIVRIDDWHTHHNAIFFFFFLQIHCRDESLDNSPDSESILSFSRSSQLEQLFVYLNTRQWLIIKYPCQLRHQNIQSKMQLRQKYID